MNRNILLLFVVAMLLWPSFAFCKARTIRFPSTDSVLITADLYLAHPPKAPFILLFHRAGWSRGEYASIAPRLNHMGFNCMSVDLRSGESINGIKNQTHISAVRMGKKTGFLDAERDIIAATEFVKRQYAPDILILWGSSYSASLVVKIIGEKPHICQAALLFSPGEYFVRFGKSTHFIRDRAKNIQIPVFFTSESSERPRWWTIFEAIPHGSKTYFLPEEDGAHGSKALWPMTRKNQEYWRAVEAFLQNLLPGQDHEISSAQEGPDRRK